MAEHLLKLPLAQLHENPDNPRRQFGDLAELAQSVKKRLIEPVIARKRDEGGFWIVAGHRRCRAAKLAGLKEIDVIVRELSRQEALEIAMVENTERESLNALELAEGYAKLMSDYRLTADQVADRVGISRAGIYSKVKLLDLIEPAKKALTSGKLSDVAAERLASVRGERLQERALAELLAMSEGGAKPSVRAVERLLRAKYMGEGRGGLTKKRREEREHGVDVAFRRRVLERLLVRVAEQVERRAQLSDVDLRAMASALAELGGEPVRQVFQRRGARADRLGKVVGAQLRSLVVEAVLAPWLAIDPQGEYSAGAKAVSRAYEAPLGELEKSLAAQETAEGLFKKR